MYSVNQKNINNSKQIAQFWTNYLHYYLPTMIQSTMVLPMIEVTIIKENPIVHNIWSIVHWLYRAILEFRIWDNQAFQ